MSNDRADDGPTSDADHVDKHRSQKSFSDKCTSVQDISTEKESRRASGERNIGRGSRDLRDDEDDFPASHGDICRICHMGGFSSTGANQERRGKRHDRLQGVDSQMSTLSSYSYLGPLISACMCRGTVALVHAECLERWLTESGHSRCELCGYKYATKRVPRHNIFRSVVIWLNTVIVTRQMLLDILYLVVTTPLALFSCYICVLAVNMLLKKGLHEVPWMIVAMLPTCTLTLIAYWGWILTLGRIHGRRWRRFWRSNFVIRLIPENANNLETTRITVPRSIELGNNGEEDEARRNDEEDEEIMQIVQTYPID